MMKYISEAELRNMRKWGLSWWRDPNPTLSQDFECHACGKRGVTHVAFVNHPDKAQKEDDYEVDGKAYLGFYNLGPECARRLKKLVAVCRFCDGTRKDLSGRLPQGPCRQCGGSGEARCYECGDRGGFEGHPGTKCPICGKE